MICVDESGRDPRAELERLFELVRNEQARAKRGVVKHQELRTRRRAVDFAMGPPVVETTEVVSVRVREDVCTATSDEIVHIDGSPNKWLLHVDGLRQDGYKQKACVRVRACVRARSSTCACVCVLCCMRALYARAHTHTQADRPEPLMAKPCIPVATQRK